VILPFPVLLGKRTTPSALKSDHGVNVDSLILKKLTSMEELLWILALIQRSK
jgi:hypothetical protein